MGIITSTSTEKKKVLKQETKNTESHYNKEQIHIQFTPDKTKTDNGVIRKDLEFKNNICFEISDLITEKESQSLIDQLEMLTFEKINWEYPDHYRDCLRKLVFSQDLSKTIWERLVKMFKYDDFIFIRPYGIGTEGKWLADSINPCFRFTKYEENHFFTRHKDGGFVTNNNNRSILTLMIYLNDDFEGGETILYEGDKKFTIKPQKFSSVVFNHDIEHEGLKITKGNKYILRTDIMFVRYNYRDDLNYLKYQTNEDYLTAEELYQNSIKLQKNNDPEGSTKSYISAQKIISQYPTYSKRISYSSNHNIWGDLKLNKKCTFEVMKYIYSINPMDKCNLSWYLELRTLNREWERFVTSNKIWKTFVENKWGLPEIRDKIYPDDNRLLEIYKMRIYTDSKNQYVLIDVGQRETRYMFSNTEINESKVGSLNLKANEKKFKQNSIEIIQSNNHDLDGFKKESCGKFESIVSIYSGHRWQTGAGEIIILGKSCDARYYNISRAYFDKNKKLNLYAVGKIVNSLSGGINYSRTLIAAIVCLPYFISTQITDPKFKDLYEDNIIDKVLSREYVFLKSQQLDSGIVIVVDGDISTFTLFQNDVLVSEYSFNFIEAELESSSIKQRITDYITEIISKCQVFTGKYLIVSDNPIQYDYFRDIVNQFVGTQIFNTCKLDCIYDGFNLLLTFEFKN